MSLRTFTTAASASEEWTHVSHTKVPRNNPFARQQRPAFVEPIVSSAPRDRDHGEKKPKQFSFAAAARLDEATAYVPPSKRAGATESVAPASAKSYDEAFPMLGGAAAPGARATAAAAPGAKSFATLVRERAEKDAVEEEARKLADLRAAAERTEWERERALYRNVGRASGGHNPSNYGYGGAGDDVEEDGYDDYDSLDYDVYGQRVTSYNPSNYGGGHTEDDYVDDGNGNGVYGTKDDGNDDGY